MENWIDRIIEFLVLPMMFIFFCGSLALTLSIPYMIAFEGLPAGFLILIILAGGLTLFFGWFLVSVLKEASRNLLSEKRRVANIETFKKANRAWADASRARAEADRPRLEAAQAKFQAKFEADKAKLEADKAKLEADRVAHAVANEAYKRIMAQAQA